MRKTSKEISQSVFSNGDKHMGSFYKTRWQLQLGLACTLVALAGCQTTAKMETVESSSYTQRHPIVVTNDVVHLKIQGHAGKGQAGLTNVQRGRILNFISGYKETGTGLLKIKSPSSVVNDVLAARTVAEIRRMVERRAVPRSRVRMSVWVLACSSIGEIGRGVV